MPNPGYKSALGGGPSGVQGSESPMDILVNKMAEMMQNQFGLKPKNQIHAYKSPFLEWYNKVGLHSGVKAPSDFTKFSGTDDTSTVEHISRYLIQLGESGTEDAWRIRYFPLSLTGPAFTWFTSLPQHSIGTWADLEKMFHAYFFTGTNEKHW
jgi:hypothetical protein